MRIEEQVKAIDKQINFLTKYKDKFTGGKVDKAKELEYTVECLTDAEEVLKCLTGLRDNLIDCLESISKVNKSLEELTVHLIK